MADNGYLEFTPEQLQSADGVSQLNQILRTLYENVAGNAENVRVFSGYGTPEGAVTAGIGSIYMRQDGTIDTSIYVKESGTDNTGWVAKSTPSLPISVANGGTGQNFSSGTSGYYLYFSSLGIIGTTIGNVHGGQLFISSGTFVVPAGITSVYLSMIGGGGGGGGSDTSGPGGGGGAGGWVLNYLFSVTPGNSYTVTIGTGGTRGNNAGGNTPGGSGVATSFDVVSVPGGSGGKSGSGDGGLGGGGYDASASTSTSGTTGGLYAGKGGNGAKFSGTTGGGSGGSPFGAGINGSLTGVAGVTGTANTGVGGGASGVGGGGGGITGGTGGTGLCLVIY